METGEDHLLGYEDCKAADAGLGDTPLDPEKWRPALVDYRGVVTPSNQHALNILVTAIAHYLMQIHERIHWAFAAYLDAFAKRPVSDPVNDQKLVVRLEIAIAADGRVARLGVLRSSGAVAFDVAALEGLRCGQPFDPPPPSILSSDHRFYTHWEFHRDETFACSVMGARPYLLDPVQ